MMGRPIDNIFQRVTSDHIGIMNLAGKNEIRGIYSCRSEMTHKDTPEVDEDEEAKV